MRSYKQIKKDSFFFTIYRTILNDFFVVNKQVFEKYDKLTHKRAFFQDSQFKKIIFYRL